MAEGEILEAGAVIWEEIPEEAAEILHPPMTNYQDNSQLSLKGIGANQKVSCKNGTSTEASIDSPCKSSTLSPES